MIRLFERLSRAAEKRPLSPSLVLGVATFVAIGRMLGERYVVLAGQAASRSPWPWFLQIASFYLALLVVLAAALRAWAKVTSQVALKLVAMGLVLGVLPPAIDFVVSAPGSFTYEYRPHGSVPWHLFEPRRGLPIGETVVLWASIALVAASTWRKAGPARALGAAVTAWSLVLLFLVVLPTVVQALSAASGLAPSEWRGLAFVTLTQLGLVTLLGLWRRTLERLPQVLLSVLFVLVGASLTGVLTVSGALVATHFAVLGLGFALSNDWHDRAEDGGRPATTLDATFAALLMLVPLVGALQLLSVRLEPGLCAVGFLVVANAWQADPLRLKCVFPLSYKTEGFLAGLCALAGLASNPAHVVSRDELLIIAAMALGTPVALVFKDLKDVEGDRAAGVQTAFVVALDRGLSLKTTRALSTVALGLALGCVCLFVAMTSTTAGMGALGLSAVAVGSVGLLRSLERAVFFGIVASEAVLLVAIVAQL